MAFSGTESGTLVPQPSPLTPFFDFNKDTIQTLLGRVSSTGAAAKGIRFHVDQERPLIPTDLYAAACGPTNDISDESGLREDFYRSTGAAPVAFDNLPRPVANNFAGGNKAGACIFLSRSILEQGILNTPMNSNKVRLYVVDFGENDESGVPTITLVATGLDQNDNPVGPFFRSDQPCPPNCPSDPDGPYGLD